MSRFLSAPILLTALAPCLWGTTYIVFTETLPSEHPLLVAALRALPAGVLLMALGPGLPPRDKLLPLATLGLVNIGLFFGLLFVAAARLPGGVAATLAAAQPLLVGLLAWPLLSRRPKPAQLCAALLGMVGVALLAADAGAALDPIGVVAALAGAASMATGTVLIERWRGLAGPMAITAWQLSLGGAALLPVALLVEGLPPAPTALNGLGMTYLVLLGTALAYWLWVRGVGRIGADAAFLGLMSPLVATAAGAVLLGEWFAPRQWLGLGLILAATAAGVLWARRSAPVAQARPLAEA